MPRRRLTNIATRHQVFLERLKAGEVRNFSVVFDKINRATTEVLSALEVENLGKLTRKELTAVLAQLRKVNSELLTVSVDDLFARLEKLATYEAEFEAKSINQIAGKAAMQIPKAGVAYANAVAQPLSATGQLLEPFVASWSNSEVNRLNNAVQRAWGESWTNQELVQAIRGTRALNYKDGILAISRRGAEAIGRTAIQHVASTARQATWEANKDIVSRYRFVATLDSSTTAECRSLDGKTFPVGEGPIPPLHIGCRSTTVAEIDDPALAFLDEGATRSAEFGPVPADQTYYEWLQDQPAAFQDEALGKTRGALFRDGGLSADKFASLNLGRNFQPLTLDQMRELEPLAFERAGIPAK